MAIPQWAKNLRKKNTEIKERGGRYYLYEVSSVYDKELKRAKKISGRYLGSLDEEKGFIPAEKMLVSKAVKPSSKEFGASHFLMSKSEDIYALLKEYFPNYASEIYCASIIRTMSPCALKYVSERYDSSYLSNIFPNLALSPSSISRMFNEIGKQRDKISLFMKEFIPKEANYILFDGTSLISHSKHIDYAKRGYNSKGDHNPQINLMYAFCLTDNEKSPIYYKKIPGDIREVTAFRQLLNEMDNTKGIVIADKGFASLQNMSELEENDINYIIPLRRSSTWYDDSPLKNKDKSGFDGHFMFNGRPIWYSKQTSPQGKTIFLYQDSLLEYVEQKDYMERLMRKKDNTFDEEEFMKKQLRLGTIVLVTSLGQEASDVYYTYKMRNEIEQMFDMYKNELENDTSNMQSNESQEAWCFLNHLSMMLAYRTYMELLKNDGLKKYSVIGILKEYLKEIRVSSLDRKTWTLEHVSKRKRDSLKILNLELSDPKD